VLVTSLAARAALAIQNARAYSDAVRRASHLGSLATLSQSITVSLDTAILMDRIVRTAASMRPGAFAATHVYDAETDTLRYAGCSSDILRELPDVRDAKTHKFSIAGHDGYLTVGLYEDGTPGEVFLKMSKEGSTVSGLMDTIAVMTSISLQYGVPLKALVDKFSHTRFEPSGFTGNPDIPIAKSVTDYVFRWLGLNFPSGESIVEDAQDSYVEVGERPEQRVVPIRGGSANEPVAKIGQEDAPPCNNCGTIMVRAGACYACPTCGETGGCG